MILSKLLAYGRKASSTQSDHFRYLVGGNSNDVHVSYEQNHHVDLKNAVQRQTRQARFCFVFSRIITT